MEHTLSKDGVKPDKSKIQAVQEFERPKPPAEVLSFLGLVNFFATYIPNFGTIAQPLREHTRKKVEWNWGHEQ